MNLPAPIGDAASQVACWLPRPAVRNLRKHAVFGGLFQLLEVTRA